MTSRGYRNNNPLNIRIGGSKFDGEIQPSKDTAFKQFESMAYGFRAALVILRTYQTKHKLLTLTQIINRWAPPIENDTQKYIDDVAKMTHIDKNSNISHLNKDVMIPIIVAMAKIENGTSPNIEDAKKGWELFINK